MALTVSKIGTGDGTVRSTPSGIMCGSDCVEEFFPDTEVDLSVEPDMGIFFDGWLGDSDCADGSLTMTTEANCTATFDTCTIPSVVVIPPQTLSGLQTLEACNQLNAELDVTISSAADITLRAGNSIVLDDGF